MGVLGPNRTRGPRRFSYEPRYYNPQKEESLKRRMRIQSRSRQRRRNPIGIVIFLVLLGMVLYIFNGLPWV